MLSKNLLLKLSGPCAALTIAIANTTAAHASTECRSLVGAKLADGVVTSAGIVEAGRFVPVGQATSAEQQAYAALPAFCQVEATLRPVAGSEIRILVWLPTSEWAGKMVESGNGAFDPAFTTAAMSRSLKAGFVATSSDTGHTENSASFALGHPQKLIDFAYRAVHENAVAAKSIARLFYGRPVLKAYFVGCSTGGRQAYGEAQRYPTDFDGIVAGDPGINFTHQTGAELAHIKYIHDHPGSEISVEKLKMLHAAVIAACDSIDGVKDGVIENPLRCGFQPASLLCKEGDASDCLTAPQVALVERFYRGVRTRTGEQVFPGYPRGAELGWERALIRSEPLEYGLDAYRLVALQDPKWDFHTMDPDRDIARADRKVGAIINTYNPDLRAFFERGGKLIGYHGFSDPMTTAMSSIVYFGKVAQVSGGQRAIDQSYRLFMIPGMQHCEGGLGTDCFDMLEAIDHWVESGRAPDRILAAHMADGKIDKTRPLCPFPKQAVYKGSGSTDDASNFICGVA